jgi:hypothetical protein
VKKPTAAQLFIWAAALSITTRITWIAVDHGMPIAATVTIASSVLLTMRTGAEQVVRIFTAARAQSGTTR